MQPKKNTQTQKRNERNERSQYQKYYNKNTEQTNEVENNLVEPQYQEQNYSNRGRNFYRGRSYRGRGRGSSNRYYSNRNYYNYNYNNYYNDYDLFDHELGVTYKVVEVNLDDNKEVAEKQEEIVENKQENGKESESHVNVEASVPKENEVEVKETKVEEVKIVQPKEIKTNTSQIKKVHSPSYEDDSVIPPNITSNINNIIEDNETPSNLIKENIQIVTEPSLNQSNTITNMNLNKANYNQSVHNFQISSRKPIEELSMHSQSITLGNTNQVNIINTQPTTGTPFQINPHQNKKNIPTQTTKNTQTQPRKPENTQAGTQINPMMGMPEYFSQAQPGYMPWPLVYFPPMQGMNYDPSQMSAMNQMYPQMYYVQQSEVEDSFVKNKKSNFPPIQNPTMNVKLNFKF